MSLLEITESLSRLHHIRPSRSKGQNFLIDEEAYKAMIEAAGLEKNDTVLEVGPGLGFLTERLAKRTQKVITVELDDKLAAVLRRRLSDEKITNVEVYNEDILNFTGRWVEAVQQAGERLVVVANLPYNISSLFLRNFISGNIADVKPRRLTLMLQKEVAERLVAPAGEMSILSVSVQLYARPQIMKIIPAKSFWPAPEIASAVVSIERSDAMLKELSAANISEKSFFRIVKIGFSARRKMIKANLAAGLRIPLTESVRRLEAAGIAPTVRAQELTLQEWLKIVVEFREFVV